MGCNSCYGDKKEMPKPWQNPQVITSLFSGLLLAIGYLGFKLGLPDLVSKGIYIGSVIVGGYFFGREALEELIKEREIGIELLMTVGALASGAMGEWAEAATLVFLYSMSEAAEGYTGQRARHAVRALMDLAPKTALLKRENKEMHVPVELIQVGDHFIVRPGESIPTDGEGNDSGLSYWLYGRWYPISCRFGFAPVPSYSWEEFQFQSDSTVVPFRDGTFFMLFSF